MRLIRVIVLQLVLVGAVSSQTLKPEKPILYKLPQESYAVFVANQAESPLRLEASEAFVNATTEAPLLLYVLRNTSAKSIKYFELDVYKSFTIGKWGRHGIADGIVIGEENGKGKKVLQAGSVFENIRINETTVVDSRNRLEELFNYEVNFGRPCVIWFVKVTKVIFADGTVFEDKRDFTAFFGFVNY